MPEAMGEHATWNAIAHTIKDQLVAFTLIVGGAAVIGAVLACFSPLPRAGAWPYLVASALLHVGYQALLMRSSPLRSATVACAGAGVDG